MEKGSNLTAYKLVNDKGIGQLRALGRLIDLTRITDEQAAKLYEQKCPYIEKVATATPAKAK